MAFKVHLRSTRPEIGLMLWLFDSTRSSRRHLSQREELTTTNAGTTPSSGEKPLQHLQREAQKASRTRAQYRPTPISIFATDCSPETPASASTPYGPNGNKPGTTGTTPALPSPATSVRTSSHQNSSRQASSTRAEDEPHHLAWPLFFSYPGSQR